MRWKSIALLLPSFTLLFLAITILVYNTWDPYHLDSALYGLSGKILISKGKWVCTFPKRCATCYTYAALSKLFGIYNAHRIFVIISLFLFTASSSLLLKCMTKKDEINPPFMIIILTFLIIVLSTPAGLITASIGKEDFYTIGLFLLSMYLGLQDNIAAIIAGGVIWGFSLWTKQSAYMLTPMLLILLYRHNYSLKKATIFLTASSPFAYMSLRDLVPVLIHQNPNFGKFYGLFSHLQSIGIQLMIQGLGLVGVPVLIISIIMAMLKRDKISITIAINSILMFMYLTNLSVVHYRHALWIAVPSSILLTYYLSESKETFRSIAAILVCLVSIYSTLNLTSNLEIKKENLPEKFPKLLSQIVEKPTVILGMDNCGLVKFYTGMKCTNHPAYPFMNENNISTNIRKIKELILKGYKVYMYPDFFAYDPKKIYIRVFARNFSLKVVGRGWFEDYHRVYIYPKLNKFLNELEEKYKYKIVNHYKAGSINIYGLKASIYIIEISSKGKIAHIAVPVYKGLALYGIHQARIYKVNLRSSN